MPTGSSWASTFYRTSYSLTNGKGLQVRLKVDGTNTQAHVTVEANDATYRRFGVIAKDGKLVVEYVDGSNARYPAELLSSLQANTWYVVRLVVDDGSGFYAEAYQESSPTVRGSYHTWMPTGKSWRFHHWIWQGNAYLDDYREFSTAGLAWDPNDWLAYSYDDLDRLTGVAAQSGWQGYSGSYVYNTIGNVTSFEGLTYSYGDSAHKHAVTSKSGGTYAYDANGNMVTRNVGSNYTLTYDQENRLTGVSGAATASFQYNADGQRVKGTVGSTTTVYVGGHYEKSGSTIRKYYTLGGQRVAMRENGVVSWLLTDALGSTAVTANSSGSKAGELRYRAYGTTRYTWGTIPTTYRYTGQREEASLGLYYYNARWYDPALGRFIQPDTIVPEPGNPQTLNRYTYALNNPLTYIDRDGHIAVLVIVGAVILVTKVIDYGWTAWDSYQSLKVMNDPNASEGAKNEAAANLAMTVAFEALEPDDFLPVSLPLDDLARKGVVKLGREAGEEIAETAAQRITREAGERVAREGLAGSVEAAQAAAKKGDEILPGLFKYGSEPIESYQQHHLWPRKMGGPRNGWAVYAKAPHYASEGIQGRLNAYLRAKVGMSQRQMEAWGRQNPDVLLEYLREFYKGENLPFPY